MNNKRSIRFAGLGVSTALVLGAVVGCGTTNSANPSNTTGTSNNQTSTNQSNKSATTSNQTTTNQTSNATANQTTNTSQSSTASTSTGSQFKEYVSSQSFSATVSALKHSVSSNGMMVMGDLNQAGALKTTGLKLKGAESFFVGNPVVGKKMFKMNAAVGTELPMRVYVWVNHKGKTEIGYVKPSTLLGSINTKLGKQGAMMDKKLAMIATQAKAKPVTQSSNGQSTTNIQFIQSASSKSFSSTVSTLKHAISSNGMMVLGKLNQAGALKTTDLKLKGAESFFVGNPVVGKKMFKMDPAVGIGLPMRVYVWVDHSGKTHIGYYQPSAILGTVNSMLGTKGKMMNKKLSMIVKQATS